MPDPLPENIPEVGSIKISIGMAEEGMGMGFAIEGLSDAEAMGHLEIIRKVLEERQVQRFMDDGDETFYVKCFHVTCPECGEVVSYEPEELFDGAEYADSEDDEE